MKKSILEVYALAVCFLMVGIATFAFARTLYTLVEITLPQFTLENYQYTRLQNNQNFCTSNPPSSVKDFCNKNDMPSVSKMRIAALNDALSNEQRSGFQSLIIALITLVTSLLVFLIHWRLGKRARKGFNGEN